jgi:peptide-methionine (R)-S-oxide reductase
MLVLTISACGQAKETSKEAASSPASFPVVKSESEWKKSLTPLQYHVLREQGTEMAFTGALWNNHEKGTYSCAGCGQALFTSDTKYESGCGWPSFWQTKGKDVVVVRTDLSHGMVRDEVVCSQCGGHLGHVFPDGPEPTGLRYCMNSAAMVFTKK